MQLSKNFTLAELTRSSTAAKRGIANTPNAAQIENLRILATRCLQPARDAYGKPITVNNGFRSQAVNVALKKEGWHPSDTSQHMTGEAADIRCAADKANNKELFDIIWKSGNYDQLIWEDGDDKFPDWVHVSFKLSGNRQQILRMRSGRTTHRKYNGTNWAI